MLSLFRMDSSRPSTKKGSSRFAGGRQRRIARTSVSCLQTPPATRQALNPRFDLQTSLSCQMISALFCATKENSSSPLRNRCRRPSGTPVGSTMQSKRSALGRFGSKACGRPGSTTRRSSWTGMRSASLRVWNCELCVKRLGLQIRDALTRLTSPPFVAFQVFPVQNAYDCAHHSALVASFDWLLLGKKDRLRAVFLWRRSRKSPALARAALWRLRAGASC